MKRITVMVLTIGALLGVTAVASASTTYFSGAIGGKHVRPRTLALTADGTLDVLRIDWRQWGGRTAIGDGTAAYHGCSPTCAQGKEHRAAVTVSLFDRETCQGRTYYNRVKIINRRGRQLFAADLRLDKWAPCRVG